MMALEDNGLAAITQSNTIDIFSQEAWQLAVPWLFPANVAIISCSAGLAESAIFGASSPDSSPGSTWHEYGQSAWQRPRVTEMER